MDDKYVPVSAFVPGELLEQLKAVAKLQDRSVSAVIRQAIRRYIADAVAGTLPEVPHE